MVYHTKDTCCTQITFEQEGDTLKSVTFQGGCNGNLQGIARLVTGMKTTDIIARLEGVQCGRRGTSCPDQLAQALKKVALSPTNPIS